MRRKNTWLKGLAMTLVLASYFPTGAESSRALAQDSHAGISSPNAGGSNVSGLPTTALPSREAEPGNAIASSLLDAWDKDRSLSLTDDEFGQAARRFFELADTKRDNRLTLQEILGELTRLLESPAIPPVAARSRLTLTDRPPFRASAYLAESLVTQSDSDGDNEITSREWRRALGASFSRWDTDRNGRLEQTELQSAFGACLPPRPELER